jgi:EAL domain-containing protein (putative c-di-GMP-specific phosphodiesterase class I)
LDEWKVPADHVVLEVTEDAFLADPQRARGILLDLRSHGVQVAIDDYGTGFSSLTYLRDLPVQELKIDRSLIRDVATDARTRMIVASTVQLAHALDMRTVAEGVEQADDYAELVAIGIDVLQGYHFARPLPAGEIEHWVRDWTSTATLLGGAHSTSGQAHRTGGWSRGRHRASRILDSPRAQTKRNTEP